MTLLLLAACMDSTLRSVKDPPDEGVPKIQLDQDVVDFEIVPSGAEEYRIVSLFSVGDATLNVTAMTVSAGDSWFTLTAPVIGAFPPDEFAEFTVGFRSTGTDALGRLTILSNDPASPNTSLLLRAGEVPIEDTGPVDTGEPPLTQPVAVCAADPDEVEAVHGAADWIGSGSYDPGGFAITGYQWTLASSPAGSSALMPAGAANRRNFVPDVAGEYVGQLVVTNSAGVDSEPCFATLNATAGDGLWIELFWTHSGDDMDLHLLAPGGSLTSGSDCYYANCTRGLEWGGGGTADNPTLDLDDIPGTGPENINVESPSRGTYTVYVHDYPGSAYYGRNDATVNIYWGGALVWTDTRNLDSEGTYFPFCEIQVPGGAVSAL
jgi:hypothetical protein